MEQRQSKVFVYGKNSQLHLGRLAHRRLRQIVCVLDAIFYFPSPKGVRMAARTWASCCAQPGSRQLDVCIGTRS